jgi:hypothetical protein
VRLHEWTGGPLDERIANARQVTDGLAALASEVAATARGDLAMLRNLLPDRS